VEVLLYNFPLTEQTEVVLGASGTAFDDFASTVNFLDGDGGSGALSAFGTRNPITTWVMVRVWNPNNWRKPGLSLGYLAGDANDPADGSVCLMVHTVLWLRW